MPKARTQASNALKALVVTAPLQLRESLEGLRRVQLVRTCARLRPGTLDDRLSATKMALRTLACRYESLEAEVKALDAALGPLVAKAAPELLGLFGMGPDSAGALLVAAGDNPGRLRSEAAFSMLCGSSPLEASSGKVKRHRLNPGRRSTRERRAPPSRGGPPPLGRGNPGVHGETDQRGQDQARGHSLSQALRRA